MATTSPTPGSLGLVFEAKAANRYIEFHAHDRLPGEPEKVATLAEWLEALATAPSHQKETALEGQFCELILSRVLGYRLWPSSVSSATAYPKPPSKLTGIRKEPDLILGLFPVDPDGGDWRVDAVLELKPPGTSYDAPQNRELTLTPVQQAFEYACTIKDVRWVLVSDMRSFRLYSVDSPWTYETFNLAECLDSSGKPTDEFRRFILFLHHDYLIEDGGQSAISKLHAASNRGLNEIAEGFYSVYSQIRSDLFVEVERASDSLSPKPAREEVVEAVQRLLDRLVFLYYCEDHPDQLIPRGTVEDITQAAGKLPGSSGTAVYHHLKALFREVDSGSPPTSGLRLDGYNGELFKHHRIIDSIDLPDSLARKAYEAPLTGRETRRIKGVWGLHAYDFWSELDEHVLGRIFEESLSDLVELRKGQPASLAEKLNERKRGGIFYTTRLISDFLSTSSLTAVLGERDPWRGRVGDDPAAILEAQSRDVPGIRVIDPSCGSGAFLVSSYQQLLGEYWRIRSAVHSLGAKGRRGVKLDELAESLTQAQLLRNCLYGVDLLPQAVELAKLALWLRSARKGEKVVDLSRNLATGDTLDLSGPLARLSLRAGEVDLVIGNPPWGGEVDNATYQMLLAHLGLQPDAKLDSWELFLRLGVELTRPGGRIAMVLPDSLLYPAKAGTRRFLFENTRVEKVHYLGPDWFGSKVRMATLLIQARKGEPSKPSDTILAMMLSGETNRQARSGELPLAQLEAQFSRHLPVARSLQSPTFDIEVFRDVVDDRIMARMEHHSLQLSELCVPKRGEEMSKAGLFWVCPNCLKPTVPGKKKKGGTYAAKACPSCGLTLTDVAVKTMTLVTSSPPSGVSSATFIDGDDINRRYKLVTPTKHIILGLPGVDYKPADLFAGPKLLIRKTGVGIAATVDSTDSRFPQTVFVYRLRPDREQEGYRLEFILATLLSRALAYYIFKRFSEVDPSKAFALLTYERLSTLPVPRIDFGDPEQRALHQRVCDDVKALLSGSATLGSEEDLRIESSLRQLWNLRSDDGAYINGEFADLPEGRFIRELFPSGRPKANRVRPQVPAIAESQSISG
jgi:hypothetical protein